MSERKTNLEGLVDVLWRCMDVAAEKGDGVALAACMGPWQIVASAMARQKETIRRAFPLAYAIPFQPAPDGDWQWGIFASPRVVTPMGTGGDENQAWASAVKTHQET